MIKEKVRIEQDQAYQHWQLKTDAEHIAWLTLDRQGTSVNTLDAKVFAELDELLTGLQKQPPKGLVILSGKSHGYIAGADINQFVQIKESSEAYGVVRRAQLILNKLEQLPCPTVAAIDGFCLGGGLEFALACRYRIATDNPATQLGLPEVKLGLHPGFGGTVRLPRLIGALKAIPLMLKGRSSNARQCLKLGLVDQVVASRHLLRAARAMVLKMPKAKKPRGLAWLSNRLFLRPLLAQIFESNIKKSPIGKVSRIHYPAPYALIQNWRRDGGFEKALDIEAQSIADLMVGDTSRQLVRLFFLQEKLKSLGKKIAFKPKRIHVIGAGTMGADIAVWSALQGFIVTLQDESPAPIAKALKKARQLFKRKLKKTHLVRAALDRLQGDIKGEGIAKADVIIEAVFENLAVKQKIFKQVERQAKPSALLATNTSSIPLAEIAKILQQPERLVGLHFFNPVAKMLLVEVVKQGDEETEAVQQAMALVAQLKKLPLPVKSAPGFLINRLLMPYLLEAVRMVEEGIALSEIDTAVEHFGMPMGPIALADQVGLDICLSVAENLKQHFSFEVPTVLKKYVEQGWLGKKTGRGFYSYPNGKLLEPPAMDKKTSTDCLDRVLLRLLNEAMAARADNIVENDDLLDAGMVFATGFSPFQGGPMAYIKSCGQQEVNQQLQQLSKQYGERFTAHSSWQTHS